MQVGAVIFLVLFGLTVIVVYLAIRRGWMGTITTSILGCIVNSLWFMMYSLARGNVLLQALTVGIIFSLLFTMMTVSIALFFRKNLPAARRRRESG